MHRPLSKLPDNNGWQLAEYGGDAVPWGQRHLLDRSVWDVDELWDFTRRYVIDGLDDGGRGSGPGGAGVLAVDETGFPKNAASGDVRGWQCDVQVLPHDCLGLGPCQARTRQDLEEIVQGAGRADPPGEGSPSGNSPQVNPPLRERGLTGIPSLTGAGNLSNRQTAQGARKHAARALCLHAPHPRFSAGAGWWPP
jgi:hypothetical protein